jgi:hypothetical protein
MRRVILWSSLFTLLLLVIAVAIGADISLHGALITNGQERYPGSSRIVILTTAAADLGGLLMLLVAAISVISAILRHQWTWTLGIIIALAAAVAGFGYLVFEGALGPGALPLLLPIATLLYALRLPASAPTHTASSPR